MLRRFAPRNDGESGSLKQPVIPGHRAAMNPESRDSGFDASHRPGMTESDSTAPDIASAPQTAVILRHQRLWNTGSSAGACHRAARRADPVADDDTRDVLRLHFSNSVVHGHSFAISPRMHASFAVRSCPSEKSEGAGNAGRSMRPQPRVQNKKHTSIVTTVTPVSPGIPRAMVLRLISRSPR